MIFSGLSELIGLEGGNVFLLYLRYLLYFRCLCNYSN